MNTYEYGRNTIGNNCEIFNDVHLGFPSRFHLRNHNKEHQGCMIGAGCIIRSGTVIYCDTIIGTYVQTGHNVLIRENCHIDDFCSIGSHTVIEDHCVVNARTNIQSNVFIPSHTKIGVGVFIGPNVVMTNDKYPPSMTSISLEGPSIGTGAIIGAHATILPSITIGEHAFVAAGALVTRNVPPYKMAIGSPARIENLPKEMIPK